jgi:hypothetical protein
MKVEKTTYPGWNQHPVFRCDKMDDVREVLEWAYKNSCDPFYLSTGSTGYVFQIRKNHEWFVLRWL